MTSATLVFAKRTNTFRPSHRFYSNITRPLFYVKNQSFWVNL
ncbi:hypothetical protein [Moraxella lacunata]